MQSTAIVIMGQLPKIEEIKENQATKMRKARRYSTCSFGLCVNYEVQASDFVFSTLRPR
jgi:hypothetical protein